MKLKLSKAILYLISFIYIAILIKIVLLKHHPITNIFIVDTSGFRSYNLVPFKIFSDFSDILKSTNWLRGVSNILGNIAIFVPLGLLLPNIFKKMKESYLLVVITTIILSIVFEVLQYTLYLGSADIDDVLLNTLGGCIGLFIYYLIFKKLKNNEFIIRCLSILLILVMSIPGFYIARNEFGNLLGLTSFKTEYRGNESIPTSESDINGTLIEINSSSIKYYKGLLSDNKDVNKFLETATSKITKETKLFRLNIIEGKNKATFDYSPLSIENIKNIEKNSSVTIWLNKDNTANVIVISKPLSIDGGLTSSSTNNSKSQNSKKENISGSILNINRNDVTINLIMTKDLENGQQIATSGLGKNAVKVPVKLKDTTTYVKRITSDNGITHRDEKGYKSDLKIDSTIEITGIKEGDTFIADSIIIYEFN